MYFKLESSLDVFWTSYVRSIYVLCLRGSTLPTYACIGQELVNWKCVVIINTPLSIPAENIRKPLEKENEDQRVAEKGKRIMKLDLKVDECPKVFILWFKNCDFAYCKVWIMLFGKINVSSFGSFGKYHQFWMRLWIFNGQNFSASIALIFVLLF